MKMFSLWVTTVLFVLSLAGCYAESDERTSLELPNYTLIHFGQYLESGENTAKSLRILDTEAAYRNLLAQYSTEGPIEGTLEGKAVLLLDMGVRPNGGFNTVITRVTKNGDVTSIYIQNEVPDEECAVTTAVSNPYAFYLIDANSNYLFKESQVSKSCS